LSNWQRQSSFLDNLPRGESTRVTCSHGLGWELNIGGLQDVGGGQQSLKAFLV
jgi:hypothetical protein